MAWLESNRGRLLIGFRYRGERCREYLDLDDNRDNRRVADRTLKEIEGELAIGKFDYAARFPESPRLVHFGLTPQPIPAPSQEETPQMPTLGAPLGDRLRLRSPHQSAALARADRAETDRPDRRRRHQSFSR